MKYNALLQASFEVHMVVKSWSWSTGGEDSGGFANAWSFQSPRYRI